MQRVDIMMYFVHGKQREAAKYPASKVCVQPLLVYFFFGDDRLSLHTSSMMSLPILYPAAPPFAPVRHFDALGAPTLIRCMCLCMSHLHRSGYRRQRVSVAGRDVTTWGAPFGGILRSRDSSWEMRTMDDGFDLLKQGEVVDGVFLLLFKF